MLSHLWVMRVISLKRRDLLKPELSKDFQSLCSASTPVTTQLFGDDLSKFADEISKANKVATKISASSSVSQRRRSRGGYCNNNNNNRQRNSSFLPHQFCVGKDAGKPEPRLVETIQQGITSVKSGNQRRQQVNNVSSTSHSISPVGNVANRVDQWSKITSDKWVLETIQGYHLEFERTPWQKFIPGRFNLSESEILLFNAEDRKYLRFCWHDKVYEFTCLPFGYKLAPRVFTKVLKPVNASLRFRHIRVIYYIDDTLVICKSSKECAQHARDVCQTLSILGFTANEAKSQLFPMQQINFLGFAVYSVSMTLSLPTQKIDTIINACRSLLENPSSSIRDVAHVSGLIVSAFRVVKYLRHFYRSVELCKSHLISNGCNYDDKTILSETARSDLLWIIHNIQRYNGLSIVTSNVDFTSESDASMLGWGACCNGQSTCGLWSEVESRNHINYLETLGAFFALKCFARDVTCKHIQLKLDNTTAVSYVNKMGGIRSCNLDNLAREIWLWCID
ncbi:uncharacterized protein LOC125568253 [Nematostella vectensis]|uniref:uncharacterized protein LOC125568253 n=1 Tax=Nematostella vectensis TaxID=45351 RepID=UPI002076E267|nr:uncharacterized protein LOC125568253 [Nematostella vectensis]